MYYNWGYITIISLKNITFIHKDFALSEIIKYWNIYKDCQTGYVIVRNRKEKREELVPTLCMFPLLAPAHESALITVRVELIP